MDGIETILKSSGTTKTKRSTVPGKIFTGQTWLNEIPTTSIRTDSDRPIGSTWVPFEVVLSLLLSTVLVIMVD